MSPLDLRFVAIAFLAFFSIEPISAQNDAAGGWRLIDVPGTWESPETDSAKDQGRFAWYRTWLKPHDSYFTPHERDLFAESVTFSIRDLAGAHELFVNGKRIGAGGTMPPSFQTGTKGNHRHKVPPGLLVKGAWNEIAIRVYNVSAPGGFLGEAPFIMDYFNECVLEGPWEFRDGDGDGIPGGALKERPARSGFDSYHESNRVLGEAVTRVPGPRLSPRDSFEKMEAGDGLAVELLLAEPLVAQPVHCSFDERGRLWVSQYRQYPYPAGVRPISRDKYYRTHYSAEPPPPPHHAKGRDIISIHEDTNGDGVYDTHKNFLEGLNMANAAVRGRGGVWVMHTPYLLFYPDANFDDIPDGDPVVHLRGFGLEDSHSVANGIVWGPDGWLYGAQGSTTSSRVTRPRLDPADAEGVAFEGCMVWRYHPESRRYELFAEGTGNIFGLEFDAQGRLFSGHNGGGTRGWHYVQGGYYLKQGVNPGKFGPPRNPYAFGDLPMMGTQTTVSRFSHGLVVVEGTAMPEKYQGRFLALDPLHNIAIVADRLPLGATFETADAGFAMRSSDSGFRPVFAVNAPDGSIVVADFYEHYIAHGQHYQSQIDSESGRVYRVRGEGQAMETDLDLEAKSSSELIALLSHRNKWHRQTAVRLLGDRKDAGTREPLGRMIREEAGQSALESLWAYYQAFGLEDEMAFAAVKSANPQVRLWAVRLVCDEGKVSKPIGQMLLELARQDRDVEVHSQLASSARRLAAAQAVPLVAALMEHDSDQTDAYVPLLCWWVLEAKIPSDTEQVLALFERPEIWDRAMVRETILPRLMRRFALAGKQEDLLVCARLLRLAPGAVHRAQLMKGFEEAYRGRAMLALPDELLRALDASALIVRVRSGDQEAVSKALELLEDPNAKLEDRLIHTRAVGELRLEQAIPVLLRLIRHETEGTLRRAAFASLASFDKAEIGSNAVDLLPGLPVEIRSSALTLLMSRVRWSELLLARIEEGRVAADLIPKDFSDRLVLSSDEGVRVRAMKVFPGSAAGDAVALARRQAEIGEVLRRGTGNPYAGEAIYMNRCAPCHKLFFKGGNVGPDLTLYQRDNAEMLLSSIVNPNAEVREGFEAVTVETKDGRSLVGFLTEQDNRINVLRGLDGQDVLLRREEVKEIIPTGRSLMPEGLLEALDEDGLRDLFAYLRISQPITR